MGANNGNGEKITAAEFRGMVLERFDAHKGYIADLKQTQKEGDEKLENLIMDLMKTVIDQGKCIERLNVKASIWGALAGAVTGLVAYLIGGNRT